LSVTTEAVRLTCEMRSMRMCKAGRMPGEGDAGIAAVN
jgi:hypothetical protein